MGNSRGKIKMISLFTGIAIIGTGAVFASKFAGSNNSKDSVSINVAAAGAMDGSISEKVAGESELATGTGNVTFSTEPETNLGYGAIVGSTGIASERKEETTQAPTIEETTQAPTVSTQTQETQAPAYEAPQPAYEAPAYEAPQAQEAQPAPEPEPEPAPEPAPEPVVEEAQYTGEVSITGKTDDDYYAMAQSNAGIYASEISQVYDLINQERANVGVASVAYDPTLTVMASHRAAENADSTFFLVAGGHHRRPFEVAENTYKEAKTICYYYGQYGSFGEVMGKGQRTPQGIVSGWHNSQAHYNCMVSSSYTRVGIGVADGSDGKRYWVAIFMN
ncbi:CAP domain-containing protein [Lachnospira multipara]|uniref:CAP domain-containing protein n=1 Tax=Lachnospira multipara TaxID=28051 RepID=UPI000485BEB3|nr:CAP domain-containing protein [Lachnospira multipara]